MSDPHYQPVSYIHGSKLLRKIESVQPDDSLCSCLEPYENWKSASLAIVERNEADIEELVRLLNEYKNVVEPIFDSRANSAQEVLQPSIIEEFFEYLFCNIETVIGREMLRKPAKSFIDLIFNPSSVATLMEAPEITIRRKDHDFVIGANVDLSVSSIGSDRVNRTTIVVPCIALECKRYLERNMLDECSGTAEKVKRATPYCKYYVVAEYLKMDDASPEMSLIDEIYILRRQRNSDRLVDGFVPNPIYSDLIIELYQNCINHLTRIWWNPQSAVTEGKVFNLS